MRSFHPAIVLRLEKQNRDITLVEKKVTLIEPWKELSDDELTEEHRKSKKEGSGPTMVYRPDSATIEPNIRKLTESDWKHFEKLINEHSFKSMSSTRAWEWGTDGSEWILEQHKKGVYHVVNRWSPNKRQYSEFRKIGNYLIDLSSFKNEERY